MPSLQLVAPAACTASTTLPPDYTTNSLRPPCMLVLVSKPGQSKQGNRDIVASGQIEQHLQGSKRK